jgi:hypothetical protein
MHGESLRTAQAGACACVEDVLRVTSEARARAVREGRPWVLVKGVRTEALRERRWPTRDELESACHDLPAMLLSFDHHACCANELAMRRSGLWDSRGNPTGGVIVRNDAGVPTGVLLERACMMVRESVPLPSERELRGQLRASLCALGQLGFTHVHDLLTPEWMGPLLATMHDAGELDVPGPDGNNVSMRVGLFALTPEVASQHRACHASDGWHRPGRVELLGGKVFVDGTLNARTAWMLEPYAHPHPSHPRGTPLMHTEQIATAIASCHELGLQLAAHAIGDCAVRAVLDGFERALLRGQAKAGGVRVEHLEIVHEQDVPRFAKLRAIASVQPCHLLYDIEVLERELPHTLGKGPSRVLPLRDLLQSGLVPGRTLLFGSDVPIVRPDPGDSVLASVHRGRPSDSSVHGPRSEPLLPEQALREDEAWQCFVDASA